MPDATRTPPNSAPVLGQPTRIGEDIERCIYCSGKRIARAGRVANLVLQSVTHHKRPWCAGRCERRCCQR